MKLIIPNNIFSTLFVLSLNDFDRNNIIIKNSSLLTQELLLTKDAIALIPSLDLIKHRDLKVSAKYGLSFNGLLSNSYVYFNNKNKDIQKVFLKGDICSNDVIISKIIFQERYNMRPEFILSTDSNILTNDFLLSGNENWIDDNFKKGTSVSEQISDLIEYPYVNYIFVAREESLLEEFHTLANGINEKIRSNFQNNIKIMELGKSINNFLNKNFNSIAYQFTEHEVVALNELFQFIYYYGILDDLFEINFKG